MAKKTPIIINTVKFNFLFHQMCNERQKYPPNQIQSYNLTILPLEVKKSLFGFIHVAFSFSVALISSDDININDKNKLKILNLNPSNKWSNYS